MLDLLIRGGTVIDGTGAPGFSADVAIEGGVIAAVEPLPPDTPARRVIHAAGKLVTPGFIDIHRHADAAAFRPGFGELELRQGLTTIVNGNCGLSAAPFGPAHNIDDALQHSSYLLMMRPGRAPVSTPCSSTGTPAAKTMSIPAAMRQGA